MKSFEEFKAARLSMDPSARGHTDVQWEQAYEAYIASRERLKGTRRRSSGNTSHRPAPAVTSKKSRGLDRAPSSSQTKASQLKQGILAQSAYQDLRLIVNLLSYGLLGLLVINTAFKMYVFTSILAGLTALFSGLLQVVGVLLLRSVLQLLIDIPDILLYRQLEEEHTTTEPQQRTQVD